MKSLYRFIIEPKNGNQYNNTKKVGDVELIINTSIEEAKDVQRIGKVLALPELFETEVQVGDEVVVWHNVFRKVYNDQGIPVESNHYIKDKMFYVTPDLVYMVIRDGKKIAIHDNVFVEPVKTLDKWEGEKLQQHVGIVRYANDYLKKQGINEGDKIAFRKNCEYEFEIDGEKLYKMSNHRILAKLN